MTALGKSRLLNLEETASLGKPPWAESTGPPALPSEPEKPPVPPLPHKPTPCSKQQKSALGLAFYCNIFMLFFFFTVPKPSPASG